MASQKNQRMGEHARQIRGEERCYYYVGEPNGLIPPQAQVIVAILRDAGPEGLLRTELLESMKERVQTRQRIERILDYYQRELVDKGAISFDG